MKKLFLNKKKIKISVCTFFSLLLLISPGIIISGGNNANNPSNMTSVLDSARHPSDTPKKIQKRGGRDGKYLQKQKESRLQKQKENARNCSHPAWDDYGGRLRRKCYEHLEFIKKKEKLQRKEYELEDLKALREQLKTAIDNVKQAYHNYFDAILSLNEQIINFIKTFKIEINTVIWRESYSGGWTFEDRIDRNWTAEIKEFEDNWEPTPVLDGPPPYVLASPKQPTPLSQTWPFAPPIRPVAGLISSLSPKPEPEPEPSNDQPNENNDSVITIPITKTDWTPKHIFLSTTIQDNNQNMLRQLLDQANKKIIAIKTKSVNPTIDDLMLSIKMQNQIKLIEAQSAHTKSLSQLLSERVEELKPITREVSNATTEFYDIVMPSETESLLRNFNIDINALLPVIPVVAILVIQQFFAPYNKPPENPINKKIDAFKQKPPNCNIQNFCYNLYKEFYKTSGSLNFARNDYFKGFLKWFLDNLQDIKHYQNHKPQFNDYWTIPEIDFQIVEKNPEVEVKHHSPFEWFVVTEEEQRQFEHLGAAAGLFAFVYKFAPIAKKIFTVAKKIVQVIPR